MNRLAECHPQEGTGRVVSRISISLPEFLLEQFDALLAARGFENRSQAVAGMIRDQLSEYRRQTSDEIMTGTITLFYDHGVPGLQRSLADLQQKYIDEVISSLHVHLMHAHTMEVILVQGPAARLQQVADRILSMRGVLTGKLHLATVLMPPVHPLPDGAHR